MLFESELTGFGFLSDTIPYGTETGVIMPINPHISAYTDAHDISMEHTRFSPFAFSSLVQIMKRYQREITIS